MEQIIIVNPQEFWDKHKAVIQEVINETLKKEGLSSDSEKDILVIDDVCRILRKSKQTIYNWMDAGLIEGHYINESLFFFRSEIIGALKSVNKEPKKQ